MAVSLQFYTDAVLSIPVATTTINHLVDGTSDPQDFVFYLGSTVAANKFEDKTSPGVSSLTVEISNATILWAPSTAQTIGDTGRTTSKNGYRYKVQSITGTGLTGASEPLWPTTVGSTAVDNEVTWVNDGAIHESTEIKLALSSASLATAAAGVSLDVGTTINGGSANAIPVYMRIDDATAIIGQTTELSLVIKNVLETPI